MKTFFYQSFRSLLLGTCLLGLVLPVAANPASQQAIEARMEARLPAIAALKRDGKVGENNRGYLEARTALAGAEQEVLTADTADRRAIYQLVAERTGETLDSVGAQRAILIARRSPPGVWLQAPDGTWYRR